MTDNDTTDRRMRNVSHTHPYSDHGAVNRPFERGPVVAADGGERIGDSRTSNDDRSESFGSEASEASRVSSERRSDGGEREHSEREERGAYEETEADAEETDAEKESPTKMKDVDHTPPRDAESANRVFERGGKEEPVESEE